MASQAARVLLAWIGNADLAGAGLSIPGNKPPPPAPSAKRPRPGPIAAALLARPFDEAVLLVSWPKDTGERYAAWLRSQHGAAVTLYPAPLDRPTDYEAIYRHARAAVEATLARLGRAATLTFHLSPGTSPMSTVWVILGKTRFDAALIQSSPEEGVVEAAVPFELTADFLPDLLRARDEALARALQGPADRSFDDVVHASAVMARVIERARVAAVHALPVLVEGETGTGKELFARAIHRASTRASGPFVPVNCGAIPESLVEAELFGWRKGAFTNATEDRKGYFEQAHGGTLFLDEIGEVSPAVQVRLLRVLQEGEVRRVGDTSVRKADVRVIAATHRDLLAEVSAGRFREDLFYRLAVLSLKIPPLRDRDRDAVLLATGFVEKLARETGVHKKLSVSARKVIQRHRWPGNVRELQATLQRAWVWSGAATLEGRDLEEALVGGARPDERAVLGRPFGDDGIDLRALLAEVARHYLERAMADANGNKRAAAKLVGLPSYQTLTNWLEKYGVKG